MHPAVQGSLPLTEVTTQMDQQQQQHMLYGASNSQQTQILSSAASSYHQPGTSIYSQHNFGSVSQQPPLNSGNVFMTADGQQLVSQAQLPSNPVLVQENFRPQPQSTFIPVEPAKDSSQVRIIYYERFFLLELQIVFLTCEF